MSETRTLDESELLQTYLAARDEACPACRYSLRGVAGTQCPECGRDEREGAPTQGPFGPHEAIGHPSKLFVDDGDEFSHCPSVPEGSLAKKCGDIARWRHRIGSPKKSQGFLMEEDPNCRFEPN